MNLAPTASTTVMLALGDALALAVSRHRGWKAEDFADLHPGGRLIVIDLARHQRDDLMTKLAHRWPGFSDAAMTGLLAEAGLSGGDPLVVPGPLEVRIWPATRRAEAPAPLSHALAV